MNYESVTNEKQTNKQSDILKAKEVFSRPYSVDKITKCITICKEQYFIN